METVEYIWVNIWCLLDWILSQNFGNTLPLHTFEGLLRDAKMIRCFIYSTRAPHTTWMDQYQALNVGELLLSKILGSSI